MYFTLFFENNDTLSWRWYCTADVRWIRTRDIAIAGLVLYHTAKATL